MAARALDSESPAQTYVGELVIDKKGVIGTWGGSLFVQSVKDAAVDNLDPIAAARRLGGITESANLTEVAGCVLVELLDHTFDIL